jgi:hypothetical protein
MEFNLSEDQTIDVVSTLEKFENLGLVKKSKIEKN